MEQNKDKTKEISEKLIDAAQKLDVEEVKRLIGVGAQANYVRYTDSNCWYSGNTHTPLYSAVHANFKDKEKQYVETIEILLKNKANPNFKATRGGWNHSESYPTFNGVLRALRCFEKSELKIKLLKLFVDAGININQQERHGRSKGWRDHSRRTCFLFNMMDTCGMGSKIDFLKQKTEKVNLDWLINQRQKQLRKMFMEENEDNEEYKIIQEPCQDDDDDYEEQPEKPSPKIEQSQFDTSLIEALIECGADPNSFTDYHYWQNYSQDQNEDQETLDGYTQTVLHRAISNNCTKIVRMLLEKGAQVDRPLEFITSSYLYPNQWTQEVKLKRKQRNEQNLRNNEDRKEELLQELQQIKEKLAKAEKKKEEAEGGKQEAQSKKQETEVKKSEEVQGEGQEEDQGEGQEEDQGEGQEEDQQSEQRDPADLQQSFKETLRYKKEIDFQIFKGKKYLVDSDLPYSKYENKRIPSIELAQLVNASPEIIEMLKKHLQTQAIKTEQS